MLLPVLSELPVPPPGKNGWPWTEETHLDWGISNRQELPLVSIVTPSYNQSQFLEETIRSVLLQRYPYLEYIIVDGGSEDGSLEIISKYARHLTHWVSEPDSGQADAINKGWRKARGEIVAYLNSDDLFAPGAIFNAVKYFIAHPECDVIYGDAVVIDEVGSTIGQFLGKPFDYLIFIRTCRNVIPQPSAFIRRDVLERVGFLNAKLHFILDFDLWARLGPHSNMRYVPESASLIRVQHQSKTSRIKIVAARETIQFYEALFSRPDLSQELVAIRSEAMSNAFLCAASYAYAAQCPQEARSYFRHAFSLYPKHITAGQIARYLATFLGAKVMSFSRDWLYRLGGKVAF